MKGPDNFITGAAIAAFVVMMLINIPPVGGSVESRQRNDCIYLAKSVDCVHVWVPVGEAKP